MGAIVCGQWKPRRLARQDERSLEPQSHDMGAGGRYGKSRVIARTTRVYRPLESWPGLSRPSTSFLHKGLQRERVGPRRRIPAAQRGGMSLRWHDGGEAIRSDLNWQKIFLTAMSKCHLLARYWVDANGLA